MAQIFVSYKHNDRDFATLLVQRVEDAGFTPWLDDNIQPGEEWRDMIDTAIRASDALVVIVTPEAQASEYVTYEWAFALGVGVPVIPVLLRETPRLHPRLDVLQFLDFTHWRQRPWDDLIRRLEKVSHQPGRPRPSRTRKPSAQVRELLDKLDDKHWDIRRDAVLALGDRRDPALVPRLVRVLTGDRSMRVRAAAAEALGWIGDPAAIPDLQAALDDSYGAVQTTARAALQRLGQADPGEPDEADPAT